MIRIAIGLSVCLLAFGMSAASAEEVDKKQEELENNVRYVLGYIDCGMTEYLDPKWLDPTGPLITIDRQTGNWDFVQNTSPDAVTQKAIERWASDATNYHYCYKEYMTNLEKHFHLVDDYHEEYKNLHNLNQSHIVEVSQKVQAFTEAEHPISQKFGWQYVSFCGRLYANTVTEEEARKWADCSLRYEKKLSELIAVIRSRAAIEQAQYLGRLFATGPE